MKFLSLSSTTFLLSTVTVANAFNIAPSSGVFSLTRTTPSSFSNVFLFAKNEASSDSPTQQQAFAVGTFVEFVEKSREHVGKISKVEHKSSGGARYKVVDSDGKTYDIADKAVSFAINAPNSPGACEKLYSDFLSAHDASVETLQSKLDISPEILEIAWEETASEDDGAASGSSSSSSDHVITPSGLVDLVHSHTASAIEKYMAWKILRTDMAHVFFKEIKEKGRVVSFKAKARKAVDAAKQAFCNDHQDSEMCLV